MVFTVMIWISAKNVISLLIIITTDNIYKISTVICNKTVHTYIVVVHLIHPYRNMNFSVHCRMKSFKEFILLNSPSKEE